MKLLSIIKTNYFLFHLTEAISVGFQPPEHTYPPHDRLKRRWRAVQDLLYKKKQTNKKTFSFKRINIKIPSAKRAKWNLSVNLLELQFILIQSRWGRINDRWNCILQGYCCRHPKTKSPPFRGRTHAGRQPFYSLVIYI